MVTVMEIVTCPMDQSRLDYVSEVPPMVGFPMSLFQCPRCRRVILISNGPVDMQGDEA